VGCDRCSIALLCLLNFVWLISAGKVPTALPGSTEPAKSPQFETLLGSTTCVPTRSFQNEGAETVEIIETVE
jgi:hypothetical protein